MKKILCAVMAMLLCLSLVACGGKEPAAKDPFLPAETVKAVVDSGAFSGEMMEFDYSLLFQLPGEQTDYEGTVVYYNMLGISEVAAVVKAADAEKAAAAEKALKEWVETNKTNESSYRPEEAKKLSNAIVETRGNTVLLVVAADVAKAKSVIS